MVRREGRKGYKTLSFTAKGEDAKDAKGIKTLSFHREELRREGRKECLSRTKTLRTLKRVFIKSIR